MDRRAGRRDRRLRVPRQALEGCGAVALDAGRAEGARARHRRALRGRMRALRPAGGLPQDHPLDQQRAARRPAHLPGGRFPPGPQGTAYELRPRPGRRDVGAPAVRLLAAAAAAATGIQVGSAMVATRYVVDQTGPASLALLRYAIGFCCLLPPVLLAGPRTRFGPPGPPAAGLLGIIRFVVP